MTPQVTTLAVPPSPDLMRPVRNAPLYKSGDVVAWMKSGQYRGNKPDGGLWTSSHTPDDDWLSDWHCALEKNALVKLGAHDQEGRRSWLLMPVTDARVLAIETLEQAQAFTLEYRLGRVPLPNARGMRLATVELTDWQRVGRNYDGVHLTGDAADEIAWDIMHGALDTAFHAWNCESTLWFRWIFDGEATPL